MYIMAVVEYNCLLYNNMQPYILHSTLLQTLNLLSNFMFDDLAQVYYTGVVAIHVNMQPSERSNVHTTQMWQEATPGVL